MRMRDVAAHGYEKNGAPERRILYGTAARKWIIKRDIRSHFWYRDATDPFRRDTAAERPGDFPG